MDEVRIKIETDENEPQYKPHNHNSNPISMEISLNGKYLVTYSEKDKKIVSWNVEDIEDIKEGEDTKEGEDEEGKDTKEEDTKEGKNAIEIEDTKEGKNATDEKIKEITIKKRIFNICVSNEKILAYINKYEISKYKDCFY